MVPMPDHGSPDDPARRLRVGNAERDAVVERLHEAGAEGRLDLDELGERIQAALEAKTYADLDRLVDDLPGDPASVAFGAVEPAPLPTLGALHRVAPGDHPDRPLDVTAGWENEVRRGRWEVPRYLRANPSFSNIELSFLEVGSPHREIHLEVIKGLGKTTIVVPFGWGVDIAHLEKTAGSVRTEVDAIASERNPLIRVVGNVGWGSFHARHASWLDRRRLAKRT